MHTNSARTPQCRCRHVEILCGPLGQCGCHNGIEYATIGDNGKLHYTVDRHNATLMHQRGLMPVTAAAVNGSTVLPTLTTTKLQDGTVVGLSSARKVY